MSDVAGPSGHRTPSPQTTPRAYKTRSASKANESDRSDTSNRASQLQPVRNPLIRIGSDFQVKNDQLDELTATQPEDYPDRDDTVWSPSAKKEDDDLQKFCDYALTARRLREDHALYVLMKYDYDIEEAKRQVELRRCLDEEWSDEDKEIFRNAFPVFKKDFHRLAKMFPNKAIYQVVEYYYNTKRAEHYRDYIDPDVDVDSLTSDEEEKKAIDAKDMRHSGVCENCGMIVPKVYAVHEMEVCRTCKAYFRVTNQHRPCRKPEKLPRRVMCPSDMTEVAEQFIAMSEHAEAERFAAADEDDEIQVEEKPRTHALVAIDETKTNILEQKKHAEAYRVVVDKAHTAVKKDVSVVKDARQFLASISSGSSDNTQRARIVYSWTKHEKEAAFHCLVSYPGDFEIASQIVKTKSSEMIKSFYYEHREMIDEKITSTRKKMEEEIEGNDLDADLVALAQSAPAEVIDLE